MEDFGVITMIAMIGLASRMQSGRAHEIYSSYKEVFAPIIDIDHGLVCSSDEFEEKLKELARCSIIIVAVITGGTKRFIVRLGGLGSYVILLSHNTQNALASVLHALYILSKGDHGRIIHIHGGPEKIAGEAVCIIEGIKNIESLRGKKILLIGVDEEYIDKERYDMKMLKKIFGITVETINLEKFYEIYSSEHWPSESRCKVVDIPKKDVNDESIKQSLRLYRSIKKLLDGYCGGGIRCFPMISKVNVTPCIAVSKLIDEDIIVSCEADLPSLITMLVVRNITKRKPFMANVEDVGENRIIIAHCTIALSMVKSALLRTHFESGYGVAIQGKLRKGEVTLVKISPDFSKVFITEGKIVKGENFSEDFCRTQAIVEVYEGFDKFMTGEYGHHIIMVYGRYKSVLSKIFKALGLKL